MLGLWRAWVRTDDTAKTDEFSEKFQMGGWGVISNLKIYVADFVAGFFRRFQKKLQPDFPKMRGGGSKAVWDFSENSSILVASPVPKGILYRYSIFPKNWY